MESIREEEKKTTKNTWQRDMYGVGSEDKPGLHQAGDCHHGATQDPVDSFHRWLMLPGTQQVYGHK